MLFTLHNSLVNNRVNLQVSPCLTLLLPVFRMRDGNLPLHCSAALYFNLRVQDTAKHSRATVRLQQMVCRNGRQNCIAQITEGFRLHVFLYQPCQHTVYPGTVKDREIVQQAVLKRADLLF